MNTTIEIAKKIFYIAEKDAKIYFFKAPNLTFGLVLPLVLYLAFAIGRTVDATFAVPGIVAIAVFFGAGAIQAVSLPLERRTGTFNSLVTAPISLFNIMLGKALAGFFFGIVLSLVYTIAMIPFSPVSNVALFALGNHCLFVYVLNVRLTPFCSIQRYPASHASSNSCPYSYGVLGSSFHTSCGTACGFAEHSIFLATDILG